MPVSDFQRRVARLALGASARYGFVLGGATALIMHGIVDRYTADVDLMTDRTGGVLGRRRGGGGGGGAALSRAEPAS